MELAFPLIIVAVVVFLIVKVFSRKKSKNPDKYMVVQQRETRVTNHVVKVPGGKKKRR